MVGRVARAYGQKWQAIYDDPYHETLLALYALEEMERIDALVADLRQLDGLFGINGAVVDGKVLTTMRTDLLARLRESPHDAPPPPADTMTLVAHMVALGARFKAS